MLFDFQQSQWQIHLKPRRTERTDYLLDHLQGTKFTAVQIENDDQAPASLQTSRLRATCKCSQNNSILDTLDPNYIIYNNCKLVVLTTNNIIHIIYI